MCVAPQTPISKIAIQKLNLTSEFNEVYFSEQRNFEATHKIPTSKNKFGRGTNFAWQNSEAVVPNC